VALQNCWGPPEPLGVALQNRPPGHLGGVGSQKNVRPEVQEKEQAIRRAGAGAGLVLVMVCTISSISQVRTATQQGAGRMGSFLPHPGTGGTWHWA